ncbi:OGG1, partial [Symbiodinium pilosum]
EKLRQLLLQHGSFDKVEVVVKQWAETKRKQKQGGGYVTKQWLMDNRSFDKTMADKSFEWAKARGLHRISEITGAEEADIPFDFSWSNTNTTGQRIEFENGAEMEVACFIFPACMLS